MYLRFKKNVALWLEFVISISKHLHVNVYFVFLLFALVEARIELGKSEIDTQVVEMVSV
jgi:hypothetical protein